MPKKANPTARDTKNPLIFDTIKKKFVRVFNKDGTIKKIIQKGFMFPTRVIPKADGKVQLKSIIKKPIYKKKKIKGEKTVQFRYRIPPNFVYDKKDKELISMFQQGTKTITEDFKNRARKRPRSLEFNTSQVYDFTNDKILPRAKVLTKGRELKDDYKEYNQKGNVIVLKSNAKVRQILRGKKIRPKNGLVRRRIYLIDNLGYRFIDDIYDARGFPDIGEEGYIEMDKDPAKLMILDEAWRQLVDTIKFYYMRDFTEKERTASKTRVLLRFAGEEGKSEMRFFNISDLDNALDIIKNWKTNDFGSDNATNITLQDLNFDWFEINLQGKQLLEGGGSAKVAAKYWYCRQPITEFNCCLDGAINKGLELKKSYRKVRNHMSSLYPEIKWGEMITFDELELYEETWKVCLDIYDDSPHYDNDNLIRKSEKLFEKRLQILYKDEHFALIDKPKFKINELNNEQKRRFGLYRKPKTSILRTLDNKEKKKDRKELLVVFDIETIFDRESANYLKTYGVSWVVWDKEKKFVYDPTIHNEEPYCYYEKGNGCLEKFVQFLLDAPDDVIYRPVGFNNSRFDNFALCETALQMGVLNNVFMCDGSILYASILGCKNTWDASRFLTGQSLDSACNSYKTEPRKRKDLIDHYEIQCFFERNGWSGLNRLLDEKKELVLYNKIDCLCLLDLVLKMRGAYKDLFDEDVFDYLTISSMGYKIQCKKWFGHEAEIKTIMNHPQMNKREKADRIHKLIPKFNIVKPKNYDDDLFFRKSLTAGRTQSFYDKLDYKGKLAMGDIKSLYPTVMGNYGNDCPYPMGDYHYTKHYKPYKLGIYRVNLLHQRCQWKNKEKVYEQFERIKKETGHDLYRKFAPNVIPKRSKDEPLDWFIKDGIQDLHLTSVDIEVLKWATEDNDCVEIIEGYYWDSSSTTLFKDFLDPPRLEKTKQDRLKEMKSDQYNVAIREGCKGISNCLSGKLLEAIHTDTSELFSVKSYLKFSGDEKISGVDIQDFGNGLSFVIGKRDQRQTFESMKYDNKKPSYLGMFVYSYARRLMYQKILSRYVTLYMDTDSACMPYFEWERLCEEYEGKNFVNTGEYGCIEEEVCGEDEFGNVVAADRLIAISPKNYAVINSQMECYSKRKFKGVRKSDFFIPLSHFGVYSKIEDGTVDPRSPAMIKVRNMNQDEIRRYRETKCCKKCINKTIEGGMKCACCRKYEGIMKKAYSTEMFEHLVRGEKIAVFCSMINKVTYTLSNDEHEWQYSKKTGYSATLAEMDNILRSNNEEKETIQMSFDKDGTLQQSKSLENVFKLKQTYLVKII